MVANFIAEGGTVMGTPGPSSRQRWVTLTVILAAFFLTVGLVWAQMRPTRLILIDGSTEQTLSTRRRDLLAALTEAGINLRPEDQLMPPLGSPLRPGASLRVEVQRALPVTLVADGKQREIWTRARTIGELVAAAGAPIGPDDKIAPSSDTGVFANLVVTLTRVSVSTRVRQEPIPYTTIRRADPNLVLGEEKELQVGASGARVVTEKVRLEDGVEAASEPVSDEIVRPPTSRIVAYGTTATIARSGETYRYSRTLDMTATGYTAGKESNPNGNGYTYTGMKAVRGVVAVDPRVIPLYTRLYIDGYGPAVAADIGGAIHGNRIDLCFDSLDEALQWGVRPVKVYLLNN